MKEIHAYFYNNYDTNCYFGVSYNHESMDGKEVIILA